MSAPVLLNVNDDAFNRGVMTRALQGLHPELRIIEAGDGNEALTVMEDVTPDAVLLDTMMPNGLGHEVMRAMRATHRLAKTPVVLASSYGCDLEVHLPYQPLAYLLLPTLPAALHRVYAYALRLSGVAGVAEPWTFRRCSQSSFLYLAPDVPWEEILGEARSIQ